MMICLILFNYIVVADLDSHKCRVGNLNKQQPSQYLAVPQKMWFFALSSRYSRLMQRLENPLCGGTLGIIAEITDPDVIQKILHHMRAPAGAQAPSLESATPANHETSFD